MHKLTIAIFSGFFLFILWIIYLANTGQESVFFELARLIPYGDKIGHLCIFGLLTLTANFASKFKTLSIGRVNLFWGSVAVFVFVSIEELSQHFMPTRSLDIYDFTADFIGILLFTWLSANLSKRNLIRHTREPFK